MADRLRFPELVAVEFYRISFPIDGRTGNLMVKEATSSKLPTIFWSRLTRCIDYITFSVPEQDLPAIRQRMKASPLIVEGEVPAEAGEPHEGNWRSSINAVDMTTGRIKLKAVFPNTNDVLWPGQFLQTKLILPCQHVVRGRRKWVFRSKPIVRDKRPRSRPRSNMPDKMAVGLGGSKV